MAIDSRARASNGLRFAVGGVTGGSNVVAPMSRTIWPQPLVVVHDVPASSRFYTELLAAESGHGGDRYEQVVRDGEIVLQLHAIDIEDHHGPLASHDAPLGNGVLPWFELADFDEAGRASAPAGRRHRA